MIKSKFQSFTVRIDNRGTGFWIGKDLIITCAHLFDDKPKKVKVTYFQDENSNKGDSSLAPLEFESEILFQDSDLDLAILKIVTKNVISFPLVTLSDDFDFLDKLETFSYPGDAIFGKSSLYDFGGVVMKKKEKLEIAFSGSPVLQGASGSPLFNKRTEKVCGIISYSIDEGMTGTQTIEGYGISAKNISQFLEKHNINFKYEKSPINLGSNFSRLSASSIKPNLLLKTRALKKYGYNAEVYIERIDVDKKLRKFLKRKINTIITGKSLSGKTRAILHNLSVYESDKIVYILNDANDINENLLNDIRNIKPSSESISFFVINDIDEYIEINGFSSCIQELLSYDNFVIIATCQNSRLDYFESNFRNNLDYFNTLSILPISNTIKQEVEFKIGNVDKDQIIDDTIGSYFFKLNYIVSRYENLDLYCKEFLRSYKCTDIYLGQSKGNIDLLKEYTEKRLKEYWEEEKWNISRRKLDEIISTLSRDGFLVYKDDEILKVETAYVDRIIAIDESENRLVQEIINYYPNADVYTKLITRVSNKKLALKIFEIFKASKIPLEPFVFSALISREKNLESAVSLFEDLLNNDPAFKFDSITINTLISKALDFKSAYNVYKKFEELQIAPDEVTYYTLLSKAKDSNFEKLLELKDELEEKKLPIPPSIYNRLIYISKNENTAFNLYDELQKNNKPTQVTISSLLKNVKNYGNILILFLDSKHNNIEIDELFINSSFSKISGYEYALGYSNLLLYFGYSLPQYSVKLLLDSTPSFNEAMNLFMTLPKEKISLGAIVFNSLIRKAKYYSDADKAFQLMLDYGVSPTKFTYNSLMNKANRRKVHQIYETYFLDKFSPDDTTFSNLIRVSKKFTEALEFYYEARSNKTESSFNFSLFNNLIEQSKNELDALICLKILKENNVDKVAERTILYLGNKFESFEKSVEFLDYIIEKEYIIKTTLINSILRRAKNKNQALQIFARMQKINIKPSRKNFNLLIKISNPLSESLKVYTEMVELGYDVDIVTFSSLMYNASSYKEADTIFNMCIDAHAMKNTGGSDSYHNEYYSFMINYFKLIKNFDSCLTSYYLYLKHGGITGLKILNSLLNYASNKDNLSLVLKLINLEGFSYDKYTYTYIIDFTNNLDDAWDILLDMEKNGLRPDARICNHFIKKSFDYSEAINWFSLIFSRFNLLPDKYTLVFFSMKTRRKLYYLNDLADCYEIENQDFIEKLSHDKPNNIEERALTWLLSNIKTS